MNIQLQDKLLRLCVHQALDGVFLGVAPSTQYTSKLSLVLDKNSFQNDWAGLYFSCLPLRLSLFAFYIVL